MNKQELQERITALCITLQREPDLTGTNAELEARIRELELEVTELQTPPPLLEEDPAAPLPNQLIGAVRWVKPKVTLHLIHRGESLLAIAHIPVLLDADTAAQIVDVEQLALYCEAPDHVAE